MTLAQLNGYFNPKKNVEYEIFTFRQGRQRKEGTLDQFQTRLRQLSQNCEFEFLDREIKSQIVQGCLSTRLHRRALRDSKMTLLDLLMYGRSLETSELQATGMEKTSTSASEVNRLTSRPQKQRVPQTSETPHVGIVVAHIHTPEVENLAQLMANTVHGHCGRANHFS